jgi:cardiolipin synthase
VRRPEELEPQGGRRLRAPRLGRVTGALWARWLRTLERLAPLGGASEGNQVDLYSDGDAALGAMLEAIEEARRRVWLETYILEPDPLGARFVAALSRAANRGCEVVLHYDSFGSPRVDEEFLAPIRLAGGRVVPFNPFWSWRDGVPFFVRDHRKILVVDDEVAFCGGLNLSVDYGGPVLGNGRMRDTLARISGPAARDLARIFLSSLGETSDRCALPPRAPPPREDGCLVQVLGSNAWRQVRSIQKALRQTLYRATLRCYVTTPYFVPPQHLKRALLRAARRGLDVRILTAGESDVPLVRLASQHLYGRFLQCGVRVFEMFGRTLHAKTATIDGVYAMVGSFNLDRWSDRRNLEVAVTVFEPRVAHELEVHFERDLAQAEEVTLATWKRRSWWRRLLGWVAYQILRL